MLHINLSNIRHNVKALKSLTNFGTKFLSVVKNNAYGHGLVEVSRAAVAGGADWLGVVHVWEGVILRQAGLKCPILVLGWVDLNEIEDAVQYNIDVPVMSLEQLKKIASTIQHQKSKRRSGEGALRLNIHIKIETGLHRFGAENKELQEIVEFLSRSSNFRLQGMYSHLAAVEEAKMDYAQKQLARFKQQIAKIHRRQDKQLPINHLAATAATILMPETHLDMVRCGIGIYGLWPSPETQAEAKKQGIKLELKPALEWRESIVGLKKVAKGEPVGYGCSWVAPRDSIIGLLPVGYADGLDRSLSNKGKVMVEGQPCDIVGRICTNVTFVNLTPKYLEGGGVRKVRSSLRWQNQLKVTIFSADTDSEASVDTQAARADTINYELVTRLSEHLERKFYE